jgi:cob(I)alamin adenosyltransferase
MLKIYTKTGDTGYTTLVGGKKIHKSDVLLDIYGTCDELNAHIGALTAEEYIEFLTEIQEKLFIIGGILATPKGEYEKHWATTSWDAFLSRIEKEIEDMAEGLPPLSCFLLPQGSRLIAQAHICRTVCRKFERKVAIFCKQYEHFIVLLQITNRLSDYFFILIRTFHKKFNIDEKYLKMR